MGEARAVFPLCVKWYANVDMNIEYLLRIHNIYIKNVIFYNLSSMKVVVKMQLNMDFNEVVAVFTILILAVAFLNYKRKY